MSSTADNASGTGDNANNDKKGSKRDSFLYGVLMEAASFLPIAVPVKQWLQEHVDFYVTCAIIKEKLPFGKAGGDRTESPYLYTDVRTADHERGDTAFTVIYDAINRQTGTSLQEEDYIRTGYVNDVRKSNEEVLYETTAGGNRAAGSYAYRYGIQREGYSYEPAVITAGYQTAEGIGSDSLTVCQSRSGSYYYDGYGSVANLTAGADSISYTYDAYGNMHRTGTYGEISTAGAVQCLAFTTCLLST